MTFWGLLIWLIFSSTKASAGSCPNGWVTYDGSCYSFIKFPETWSDASNDCRTFSGSLAQIETAQESVFLKGYMKNVTSISEAWIGGTEMVVKGMWNWVNGDKFAFTDWAPTEPNNFHGHDENCAFLRNVGWADGGCTEKRSFICEKS